MSRICLVDSGSCARASRSLQMHRGYCYYPWYLDIKLPYNYIIIVILHISTGRILGSGSCKTSCTKLKKVNFFTRATPLRSKTPNVVQRDMQIRFALRSSFGPKLIWAATGAPRRPNSEILPRHTVYRNLDQNLFFGVRSNGAPCPIRSDPKKQVLDRAPLDRTQKNKFWTIFDHVR